MARRFEQWNNYIGWGVFGIALCTYYITMAPTVSFWDSGEYIATSAKLEIAHPPGAPFFQLIGACFALLATEKTQIARMINLVSVVASAFTILLLYWTLVRVLRKLSSNTIQNGYEMAAILGSALVGALAFTFSDSFWFNAVETEVYAMASLVMAVLLWLGLKWTEDLNASNRRRLPLLIAFIIGLTFGIQFMGFLAIPSLVLLYFFQRYPKVTLKSFIVFNLVGVAVLFGVFQFSLTYVLKLFGWGELFFVNSLGMPFHSGTIATGILFVFLFSISLGYTQKKALYRLNTVLLCVVFLFLGFSTWLLLPIRANAHVAINENDPSDARTLLAYYNREQYPKLSPFYGAYYSDRLAPSGGKKDENPKYEQDPQLGKYKIVNAYQDALERPNPKHTGWLPRMWNYEDAENYMRYFGPLQFTIKPEYAGNQELRNETQKIRQALIRQELDTEQYLRFLEDFGEYINVSPPSFWDNLTYLLHYQWGYMYWRYFMWNFVGRQDDLQGRYDNHGNWLSGIPFLDNLHLGSQKDLPPDILENKGRNTYFFLPLLFGILGFLFLAITKPKLFWVFFVFFILTGIGIQFYTNPSIFQPRERDYSLVGSFYVFSIWIGIGVFALVQWVRYFLPVRFAAIGGITVSLFAVPLLMAFQNWDDHDRSNRRTAWASAKAYLDSTQQDSGALLFTIGDNDNFPLWYLQEVEEYRTDVRVIVTGYFAADWYIDQMKRRSYKSAPIPSQLSHEDYRYGTRDVVYYQKRTDKRWDIRDFMDWIASDDPKTKLAHVFELRGLDPENYPESVRKASYYPTNKLRIPVNKKNVLESGLVPQKDADLIVNYIDIDLPQYLTKNRLMMLDVLANNTWERPIYFSGGSFDDAEYIWMKAYLQLDGLAYKLVPIRTENENPLEMGRVDTDLMYNIVKQWDWGNSGSTAIYHDPQTRKQFGVTFRLAMARLVAALIEENKVDKAREILTLTDKNIPFTSYGYYAFQEPFLESYFKIGDITTAWNRYLALKKVYQERLEYYSSVPLEQQERQIEAVISDLQSYQRILDILSEYMDNGEVEMEMKTFDSLLMKFSPWISSEP
ncbi:MAG: DUF2723 domain-containing protein [Bacteroidota bacterium]